jgi:hypothetical protein
MIGAPAYLSYLFLYVRAACHTAVFYEVSGFSLGIPPGPPVEALWDLGLESCFRVGFLGINYHGMGYTKIGHGMVLFGSRSFNIYVHMMMLCIVHIHLH